VKNNKKLQSMPPTSLHLVSWQRPSTNLYFLKEYRTVRDTQKVVEQKRRGRMEGRANGVLSLMRGTKAKQPNSTPKST